MIKLRWNKKSLNFEKVEWSGTDTQASRQIVFTILSNPYDKDFENAKMVQQKRGRYYTALYQQAGNSIAVPIFESIFRKIILGQTASLTE